MGKLLFYLLIFLGFGFQLIGQTTASEQVSVFEIEAPQLDTVKKIWVYLPKEYNSTSKNYAVIYMHDAQNLFDRKTSFAGEWEIDEALDSIASNQAIIVGIAHGNEKRMDELTPFANETHGGGNGDAYLQFIVNTLKPYVDANFRTLKDTKNTSIFGSSLGGLISFYAVIKYPQVFGKAGVFSPSFWFSNRIFDYVEKHEIDPDARFYFMAGSEESDAMVPDQQKMIQLLLKKGMPQSQIEVNIIEGGKHNETLWKENFLPAYLWLVSQNK